MEDMKLTTLKLEILKNHIKVLFDEKVLPEHVYNEVNDAIRKKADELDGIDENLPF